MHKLVFTYGTLYEPQIMEALLGYIPQNFLATLSNFSVYCGDEHILSEEIKQDLRSKGRDLSSFKFLFAKKDIKNPSLIEGKAYSITPNDELILDWWERYPKLYRKESATIKDSDGKKYEAFIYTIDKDGEKLDHFSRDPNNDIDLTILNANKLRQKIKLEFPLAEIKQK